MWALILVGSWSSLLVFMEALSASSSMRRRDLVRMVGQKLAAIFEVPHAKQAVVSFRLFHQ